MDFFFRWVCLRISFVSKEKASFRNKWKSWRAGLVSKGNCFNVWMRHCSFHSLTFRLLNHRVGQRWFMLCAKNFQEGQFFEVVWNSLGSITIFLQCTQSFIFFIACACLYLISAVIAWLYRLWFFFVSV